MWTKHTNLHTVALLSLDQCCCFTLQSNKTQYLSPVAINNFCYHGDVDPNQVYWILETGSWKKALSPFCSAFTLVAISKGRIKCGSRSSREDVRNLEPSHPRPHLDAQNVGASFDELVSQFQIVIQGVLLPARVRDVARVRDGSLHDAPCCPGCLHAQQHVWDVVQGVKHTEDVHAVLFGHLTEPGGGRLNGEEKEIHI